MSTDKPTPETDAFYAFKLLIQNLETGSDAYRHAIAARDFARTLERQRDEYARQLAEAESVREKYATAARVISLHLKQFCDEALPYDEMIAEAARKAAVQLDRTTIPLDEWTELRRERDRLRAELAALRKPATLICPKCGSFSRMMGDDVAECEMCNESFNPREAFVAEHTPAEETKPESEVKQHGHNEPLSNPAPIDSSHSMSNAAPESPNPSGPQLLPCPFCGNEYPSKEVGRNVVNCQHCGMTGPARIDNPIKDWNQRAKSPDTLRLEATVAEMRRALEKQHQWHLDQIERTPVYFGDTIGQVNSDEYQDSQLCEITTKALSGAPSGMLEVVRKADQALRAMLTYHGMMSHPGVRMSSEALALLAPYCPPEETQTLENQQNNLPPAAKPTP